MLSLYKYSSLDSLPKTTPQGSLFLVSIIKLHPILFINIRKTRKITIFVKCLFCFSTLNRKYEIIIPNRVSPEIKYLKFLVANKLQAKNQATPKKIKNLIRLSFLKKNNKGSRYKNMGPTKELESLPFFVRVQGNINHSFIFLVGYTFHFLESLVNTWSSIGVYSEPK